ncbi:MAG: multidrug ABC transporter ATP-binding protein, partial [Actinobacteria bacterium]
MRPYWWLIIAILMLQSVVAIATLYIPTLNADIINQGVAQGDTAYIWTTGRLMLYVAFLQIVAALLAAYSAARVSMSTGRDIRAAVYERVSSFSAREVSYFGAGSLITRTTNDVQQVQMLIQVGSSILIISPLLAVGGVVMAIRHDTGLSWILTVSIPILLIVVSVVVARLLPSFRMYQEFIDGINRIFREQLAGIRVIRAFVREDIEKERFAQANESLTRMGLTIGSLFVFLFPAITLILNLTMVGIIWFGGTQVESGNTQVGTLFAFMSYAMQILMGVVMASFMTVFIPRAVVSSRRIEDVLSTRSSITLPDNPVTHLPTPGHVECDSVTFGYPGAEEPVLTKISFTAAPGSTLAIVGSTGTGKTTLTHLLPRLLDVTGGQVKIGGVDVRQLAPATLAQSVAIVPQRPYLFSGTIASNLRFGRPEASEDELWEALTIAQARDFVEAREEGLYAPISQGGTNVSGGQRQRLAIARALVVRPDILIFDDSFSALDVAT